MLIKSKSKPLKISFLILGGIFASFLFLNYYFPKAQLSSQLNITKPNVTPLFESQCPPDYEKVIEDLKNYMKNMTKEERFMTIYRDHINYLMEKIRRAENYCYQGKLNETNYELQKFGVCLKSLYCV